MKTIRKILPAVILVAVMVVMSVIGVQAADDVVVLTKADTTSNVDISYYTSGLKVIRQGTFEKGNAVLTGEGGAYQSITPANTGAGKADYDGATIGNLSRIEAASEGRPAVDPIWGGTSNNYHTLDYRYNPKGVHAYVSVYWAENSGKKADAILVAEDGFVFEMDIACHPIVDAEGNTISGALNSPLSFQMLNNNNAAADGMLTAFQVAKDSNDDTRYTIVAGDKSYSVPQGEWVHVTVQFDPAQAVYNVYVGGHDTVHGTDEEGNPDPAKTGRMLLASVSAMNNGMVVYPVASRVGGTSSSGNVSFDNYLSYQGIQIRDPFYYDNLSGASLFNYLVGQLKLPKTSAVTCRLICDMVDADYINNYWDATGETCKGEATMPGELQDNVLFYVDYHKQNYDGLLDLAKEENLKEYISRVEALEAMGRSLKDHNVREETILLINEFLAGCGEYIDREDEKFIDAKVRFDVCVRGYERDVDTLVFVNAAVKFENAQKLGAVATMKKKYDIAYQIFVDTKPDASEYGNPDDGSKAEVEAAIAIMNGAQALLDTQERLANTNRFVSIVDKISKTKLADWENDDGTLENLWRLALNIVGEDHYEKNLAFYEAYARFEGINGYFWEKIQATHIAAMNEKLAQFDDVNYIEKEGICAFVDTYIVKYQHEIDFENEEISAIIALNTQYKNTLPDYKENYQSVLEANTVRFLEIVATMDGVEDYNTLKAIFDSATEYYYSMNISGDDVIAAVTVYESARIRLEQIEYASGLFVYAMSNVNSETDADELYSVLLTCYTYYEFIDSTYEGVSAAKQAYDSLYAAYTEAANTANGQVNEITGVVVSIRSFCDVSDLVRYALEYLSN